MELKTLLAATLIATSGSALANSVFEKPEDAIEYRQSVFFIDPCKLVTWATCLKGKVPFDAARSTTRR